MFDSIPRQISVPHGWVASHLAVSRAQRPHNINVGDHVKTTSGKHQSRSGLVVEVVDDGSSLYVREHGTRKLVRSISPSHSVTYNIL